MRYELTDIFEGVNFTRISYTPTGDVQRDFGMSLKDVKAAKGDLSIGKRKFCDARSWPEAILPSYGRSSVLVETKP